MQSGLGISNEFIYIIAFLVGNHFIILKLGRRVLDKNRDEVTLEELTSEMAGGRELAELSHELKGR